MKKRRFFTCLSVGLGALCAITAIKVFSQDTALATGVLQWRSIGPLLLSARIDAIAAPVPLPDSSPAFGQTFYVGGSGGLYKTDDAGITWHALLDDQPASVVGSIAVAPSNPDVVWVGTGNWGYLGASAIQRSRGVFKSDDAGAHWQFMGLSDAALIGGIAIDPSNANVVYVSVLGEVGTASGERGLFKTIDGGQTWKRVLFVDDRTGIVDVAINPRNSTVFAAAWRYTVENSRHQDVDTGGGIYRSRDGGASWQKLNDGLPNGKLGRIKLAISPARATRIYAVIHDTPVREAAVTNAAEGHLYRSDDDGEHWTKELGFNDGAGYDLSLCADPRNADNVYSIGHWVSADAGRTASAIDVGAHMKNDSFKATWDNHACWVDPADSGHLVTGNDFGAWQSFNGGSTWQQMAYFTGGLWNFVAVDEHKPFYRIFGTVQDAGAWMGPSRTTRSDHPEQSSPNHGISNSDWTGGIGPEEGRVIVSGFMPDKAEFCSGWSVYDVRTHLTQSFSGPHACTQPFLSINGKYVLYAGGLNRVFRSLDAGHTWTVFGDHLGDHREWIELINQSPIDPNIVYGAGANSRGRAQGSNDLFVTTDAGKHWRLSRAPAPGNALLQSITVSHASARTAYIAIVNRENGDSHPYIFKTIDAGLHWAQIVAGLPDDAVTWKIVEDPYNTSLLFAATDDGVYLSLDGGLRWESLRNTMPAVEVTDLAYQPEAHDLIAATWGRGIFILDDIIPLELLDAAKSAPHAYLFPIRPAIESIERDDWNIRWGGKSGSNPPYGALIDYSISRSGESSNGAALEILNAAGSLIDTLPIDSSPGLHRAVWDLQAKKTDAKVAPGAYTVRLTLSNTVIATRTIHVLPDTGL